MKSLLISACLIGSPCKYCGGSNALPSEQLDRLKMKYRLVPVCPETAGGLPTPRDPSERLGDKVVSNKGTDVTGEFSAGADTAVVLCQRFGCGSALMKELSPSCGNGRIYDGSFTGNVVSGDGLAVERLKKFGIAVYGESEIEKI